MERKMIKVIFRRFKRGGDMIALFPDTIREDGMCESYQYEGQHADADYDGVIKASRPASKEKSVELIKELGRIGYNLIIRRRR